MDKVGNVNHMKREPSILKGTLLVGGTAIGGGMLALPVLTSLGGFIPSLFIYLLCWIFMASTGLLILETSQWFEKDANLVSMAEKTLGKWGKILAWILYLFLFYCLTLAYVVGCGKLLYDIMNPFIFEWQGALLFVLLFAPFVYFGATVVGKLNLFLMMGLGISYIAFLLIGYRYVNSSFLLERDWLLSFRALPIAFTAFAYQGIVPTLRTYMNRDIKKTRLAILIGSFLPLVAYIIWQWLILGIIPKEGPNGLREALVKGDTAVEPLKYFLQNPYVYVIGQSFAFFALVTSFLGVTLGLKDFLADGLGVKKTPSGRFWLCIVIFIPALIISFIFPGIFLTALSIAGGIGCALLLGLMPILMVFSGRYRLHLKSHWELPGENSSYFYLPPLLR